MKSRHLLLIAASLCASFMVAAPSHAADAQVDLQGIWWVENPQAALKPLRGDVPLTKEGQRLYAESMAALKASAQQPIDRNDMRQCLPLGPTRILQQNYPLQIVQAGNLFVIIYEHNHVYETVYMNGKSDPDEDWAYMGNSIGAWTKDSVVITTDNFNDGTYLDNTGLPHTDQLKMTRTLRKIDGGKRLEVVTTINDPVVYSKPWTVRQTLALRTDERIEEYTCGQGPTLETRYTR